MLRFEAGLTGVRFESQGDQLIGGLYLGGGEGPRPTAVLAHGVPGIEKNMDIAYALRDAGWNCLYFHYRGSWGSGGSYSFLTLGEDIGAAVRWLATHEAVDKNRLVLIGHSMGGYAALRWGTAVYPFKSLVALCPLVDGQTATLSTDAFADAAALLHGTTAAQLAQEWSTLSPISHNSAALARQPVLLITGAHDALFPPAHHQPLIDACPSITWRIMATGDHGLSRCRAEMVEVVITWLHESTIS